MRDPSDPWLVAHIEGSLHSALAADPSGHLLISLHQARESLRTDRLVEPGSWLLKVVQAGVVADGSEPVDLGQGEGDALLDLDPHEVGEGAGDGGVGHRVRRVARAPRLGVVARPDPVGGHGIGVHLHQGAEVPVGHGAVVVDEVENADVVLVNTCGFIDAAKQESIEAMIQAG